MKLKDIYASCKKGPKRFWTKGNLVVEGCTKVSAGCLNCWSETIQLRFTSHEKFNGTIKMCPDRFSKILPGNKGRYPMAFAYWNDLFHKDVTDEFRKELFSIITKSEKISNDFHFICTKRPQELINNMDHTLSKLKNVMILITMENQETIDSRSPLAKQISELGWNVGVMVQPMLEQVKLNDQFASWCKWIICGPERGPRRRKFKDAWAMDLLAQAREINVPFYCSARRLSDGILHLEVPDL